MIPECGVSLGIPYQRMVLDPGTRLGRYEIRSRLGAGGMGEVYLADDTKLDRKIALKILPTDIASNKDRLARFVREAKSAAALNHPNIAHVYEIGESAGVDFIAMANTSWRRMMRVRIWWSLMPHAAVRFKISHSQCRPK